MSFAFRFLFIVFILIGIAGIAWGIMGLTGIFPNHGDLSSYYFCLIVGCVATVSTIKMAIVRRRNRNL
jgi:hypothetical protein